MKTYDNGAGWHGAGKFMASAKSVFKRWIDRERELMALRNAVGMMAEARRADAVEYRQMDELNRSMREDALRLQWLTKKHEDPEQASRAKLIASRIDERGLEGTRVDIDAVVIEEYNAKVMR